jgi:hypothetical protein
VAALHNRLELPCKFRRADAGRPARPAPKTKICLWLLFARVNGLGITTHYSFALARDCTRCAASRSRRNRVNFRHPSATPYGAW